MSAVPWRAGGALAVALASAGCAMRGSPDTALPPPMPESASHPASHPTPHPAQQQPPAAEADTALAAFTHGQRQAAQNAAQQHRWVDAQWAWEAVLAVAPQDRQAQAGRATAQATAAQRAAEHLARAAQAKQRHEWDTAQRLYLEALTLAPDHAGAAQALRDMERQRPGRGWNMARPVGTGAELLAMSAPTPPSLGAPARASAASVSKPPGRAGAAADGKEAHTAFGPTVPARRTAEKQVLSAKVEAAPSAATATATATAAEGNEREHARLLATQGDVDAAITLLKPVALRPGAEPAARQQLAGLYFQLAAQLQARDVPAAVAALGRGLTLAPNNPQALARWRALRSTPAAAGSAGAPVPSP